jgi:Flp pilus assembly protein TadG
MRRPGSIVAACWVRPLEICSPSRFRLAQELRGSGLVEYAVITTLFMALLMGVADFGRALYAYHFVSNAAREATRYAAVRGSTCLDDGSCTAANSASGVAGPTSQSDITAFVQNVPLGINKNQVTVTAKWPSSLATCTGANPPNAPGCTVDVKVQYNFTFVFQYFSATKSTLTCTSTPVAPFCLSSESQTVILH